MKEKLQKKKKGGQKTVELTDEGKSSIKKGGGVKQERKECILGGPLVERSGKIIRGSKKSSTQKMRQPSFL